MIRRVRGGSTRYYYQHPDGKQIPLGGDIDEALKQWQALFQTKKGVLAPDAWSVISKDFRENGLREVSARTKRKLAPKTIHEYELALDRLDAVFEDAPLSTIKPVSVGKLLDELRDTPVLANRVKSTLSRTWNWARSRGKTDLPNPCIGIDGYTEEGRKVLVDSDMFWAIYDRADQVLQDWMRLDIVIGQRVTDITKILRSDVVTDANGKKGLRYKSTKTGVYGLMAIDGDLETLLEEILKRERKATGRFLLQTQEGQPVTYAMLRNRFDKARNEAREDLKDGFIEWQMLDLRKTSLNQAKTLEEARRRALHTDPRTTARHYEVRIDSTPGALPVRPGGDELLTDVSNSDERTG